MRAAVQRNPAMWLVTNPPKVFASEEDAALAGSKGTIGERRAWNDVITGAHQLRQDATNPRAVLAVVEWLLPMAEEMRRQVSRGVHVNPPKGIKFSSDVQAIVYEHVTEGPRVHGFGNADPKLTNRGNALTMTGLKEKTGAAMYALPDGSILIRNTNGNPLWREDQ
jgi:hypothetical protein